MESRKSTRVLTWRTASIKSPELFDPIYCAILNVSPSGAALLVNESASVPQMFNLVVDPDGLVLSCQVKWRSGSRIGVSFDETEAPGVAGGPHPTG